MKHETLTDDGSSIAELLAEVRALRTHNPLERGSISEGRIRVLDTLGNAIAILGHEGGASGLLLRSGGQWVPMQTWVDQRIVELNQYNANRITSLETIANNHGPRLAAAEADIAAVPGMIQRAGEWAEANINAINNWRNAFGPRVIDLESWQGTASTQISNAQSRADSAYSLANGRVTQAQLNAVIDYAQAIANAFNAHMDQYHSGGPKAPPNPPAKG